MLIFHFKRAILLFSIFTQLTCKNTKIYSVFKCYSKFHWNYFKLFYKLIKIKIPFKSSLQKNCIFELLFDLKKLTIMSYCKYIETISGEKQMLHKRYHDNHYGFPLYDDNELFCRLILEINQAGLNWEIILKKEKAFRDSFDQFNIQKVALYDDTKKAELLSNPEIIRNRLKINAAIENAKRIIKIQEEFGSFNNWLAMNHPKTKEEWTKIFKKTFVFTGGEIVNEFLMSIGFLPGSHDEDCPVYKQIKDLNPKWIE